MCYFVSVLYCDFCFALTSQGVFTLSQFAEMIFVFVRIGGNVGACAVAGIGGLGNEAKRNAKTDQLRLVPRHNINKETESNEGTEPGHCTSILLAVVGPFSSLHSKPCLLSPVNVIHLFISQSCGGAFFIAYFIHLHCTEHTYLLALVVG